MEPSESIASTSELRPTTEAIVDNSAHIKRPMVTVLLDALDERYQSDALRGIYTALKDKADLLVVACPRSAEWPRHEVGLTSLLTPKVADGAILLSGALRLTSDQLETMLDAACGPGHAPNVVSIGLTSSRATSILVDDAAGIQQAVTHLKAVHRFERIGFLCGPRDHVEARRRHDAFRDAMGHRLYNRDFVVPDGDFTFRSGQLAASRLLTNYPYVQAVLSANDEMARGALCTVEELFPNGTRPSVIGFDDTEYAIATEPPLTTVRQPTEEAGRLAAQIVLEALRGRPRTSSTITLPTQLQVRESCGCRAGVRGQDHCPGWSRNRLRSLLERFIPDRSVSSPIERSFLASLHPDAAPAKLRHLLAEANEILDMRLSIAATGDIGAWLYALLRLRDSTLGLLTKPRYGERRILLDSFWLDAIERVLQRGAQLSLKAVDQQKVLHELARALEDEPVPQVLKTYLSRLGLRRYLPGHLEGKTSLTHLSGQIEESTLSHSVEDHLLDAIRPSGASCVLYLSNGLSYSPTFELRPPADWWLYGEILGHLFDAAKRTRTSTAPLSAPPAHDTAAGPSTHSSASQLPFGPDRLPAGHDLFECKSFVRTRLDRLQTAIPFDTASVQLVDEDYRTLLVGKGFSESTINRTLLRPISIDPLVSRIIASREPLIQSDIQSEGYWNERTGSIPRQDLLGLRSWIGAPVVHDDRVVGFVTLDFKEQQPDLERHRQQVLEFVAEIAPHLFNAAPLMREKQLTDVSVIVRQTIDIVAEKIAPQDLLQTIADQVASHLNCSACTIFFPEDHDGEVLLVAKYTSGSDEPRKRRFGLSKGIAGSVYTTGCSMVLPDASKHQDFEPARRKTGQCRSMLVVPIKVGKHTIGIISADQDVYGWFNHNDARFVEALAQQAGIAIQRSQTLEFLQEISATILSIEGTGNILEKVLDRAVKLVNGTTGVIYHVTDDKLSIRARYHPPEFHHPLPRLDKKDGLTRTILDTGRPLWIRDIREDGKVNDELHGHFVSMVGVPLTIRGNVIGVLFVDFEREHAIVESELSLLTTLSGQAAIALERARLLKDRDDEVERHKQLERKLERLHEIVKERDLDNLLNRVAEGVLEILGSNVSVTVNLYDQTKDEFGECRPYGPLADDLRRPPRANGVGRFVIREKRASYHPNVDKPPEGSPAMRHEGKLLGVQSFAAIPLISRERVVGVLFVNSSRLLSFGPDERRMLELFAGHAAIALENTHEYEVLQTKFKEVSARAARRILQCVMRYGALQHSLAQVGNDNIPNRDRLRQLNRELENTTSEAKLWLAGFQRFGRKIAPRISEVDVFEVTKAAIAKRIDDFRRAHVDLSHSFQTGDTPSLRCDAALLDECICQLLGNALRELAMKRSARVLVTCAVLPDKRLYVRVEDNGDGFPADLPVEEPFVGKVPDAPGVGLTIVKEIMRAHGGDLILGRSENLNGAAATIWFPKEARL